MLESENHKKTIIDVREPDEFAMERVPGSINVPLSRFSTVAPGVLFDLDDQDLVLMCRSGKRAALAVEEAARLGLATKLNIYQGGIQAWKAEGLPIDKMGGSRLPIMQQVQVIVGATVLLASVGVLVGVPAFAWLSAFFGAGLLFAGTTGFCGLAMVLSRMPWNKGTQCTTTCSGPVK